MVRPLGLRFDLQKKSKTYGALTAFETELCDDH